MNEVKLIGNSGGDAELTITKQNFPILNLSLATSKRIKDTNKWESTWHKVKVLGKTAEMIAPQIKKGSKIFVSGELQNNKWTDKNGSERITTEILAREIYVIEKPVRHDEKDGMDYMSKVSKEAENLDDIPF